MPMNEERREFNGRTPKTPSSIDSGISWAISEQGAVSVYGGGRWPVTLYANFWRRMFKGLEDTTSVPAELLDFIEENESLLAGPIERKGAKPKTETFSISAADLIALDSIAQSAKSSNPEQYADLMTICATAKMGGGKVLFEQLAIAKTAIANHEKAKPNAANANQTTE